MKLEHNLLDILNKKVFDYDDVIISSIVEEKISKSSFYRKTKRSIRIIYHDHPILHSAIELYEISITTQGIQIIFRRGHFVKDHYTTIIDIANPLNDIKTLKKKFNQLTQFCMTSNWYYNTLNGVFFLTDNDSRRDNQEFTQKIQEILT